ncbi:MAG: thioesterase family protein [Planctomycetaceae bacterium]
MPHFAVQRRVQFSETDMAGIVHFANFFRWMEEAEHDYFRSLGLTIVARQDAVHIGWPRVAASCNFHLPLFYQQVFEVRVTVERLGVKSISYRGLNCARRRPHRDRPAQVACCLCGPEGIIESIAIPSAYLEKLPRLNDDRQPVEQVLLRAFQVRNGRIAFCRRFTRDLPARGTPEYRPGQVALMFAAAQRTV